MIKAIFRSLFFLALGILSLGFALRNFGLFFGGNTRALGFEWLLTMPALAIGIALMVPFFRLSKTLHSIKQKAYNEAYAQYEKKNYSKAIPLLKKSARHGNVSAMFYLGYSYKTGQGVEKNNEEAVYWYEKAAKRNSDAAMNNLGICYENGEGVKRDLFKAKDLFLIAKSRGNEKAINNLERCEQKIERMNRIPKIDETLYGKIASISSSRVTVNLDDEKIGYIPLAEISYEPVTDIRNVFKEGDRVRAKVINTDGGNRNLLLSKRRYDTEVNWNNIVTAMKNKEVVQGIVFATDKSGASVSVKCVPVFIPAKELGQIDNLSSSGLLNKSVNLYITDIDQSKKTATGSIREFQNEQNRKTANVAAAELLKDL